jgi:carbonic anhydrase
VGQLDDPGPARKDDQIGHNGRPAIGVPDLQAATASSPVLESETTVSTRDEVLQANARYVASFGSKAELAVPPARRFAILTCMDARLDPAKYAGLTEGDAHIIRNAGGRASDDAIRSLVISYKLLGTQEWFVIHHTQCGMEYFTDEVMRGLLAASLDTAELGADGFVDVGTGPGSSEAQYIDWLTISDTAGSVVEDVARLRAHPLVPGRIAIYGYLYDVTTGELIEVPEATAAGAPSQ